MPATFGCDADDLLSPHPKLDELNWRRTMTMNYLPILALALWAVASIPTHAEPTAPAIGADTADRIQPWPKNPRYWQYKGQPVMLLGGSKTDHLFLLDDLKPHLDEIHAVGANYVRNTMSQREGKELKPHKLRPDGKFDLDQWNEDYWQRFQNMLKWTAEREIIVQIEVWDRFDYGAENWETSPWSPRNNTNYDDVQSGFGRAYTLQHLYRDEHPFFHTIPGTQRYSKRADLIRKYQEAFVAKMLSYSLPYGHVLYCMNNETSTPVAWGQYWMTYIRNRAAERGVTVFCTDMFDDVFLPQKSTSLRLALDDPQMYPFLDVSQINSRNFDAEHWNNLQWIVQQREVHPRPLNHTKIYGSGYYTFGTGGPEDGIERFWRDILGGSASARFHRPDAGNGLNDFAKASIQAARLLEGRIKFWDITPQMELLSDRAPNEAYLAAKPEERYAVYFTNGGSVKLDLTKAPGTYTITWISVSMGRVVESSAKGGYRLMDKTIEGGRVVTLSAPYKGGWVAAIVKQTKVAG
ncbi:MAG: hypothetical protein COY42_17035 [Armatimonadetes bacterium CG_4_10_14_0_8_um_filter_66_14]|nr:MAG: hypothetical protein COZ05_15385 [Armatimonadetes bacterium CG_4_10_14_3_um_filter_59_10]PIZ42731.1 MAG: hypothetical protein COY42_17035 [Armatimonadetes bacterium CG_4_10_14_0_8_um_filter_66_14]PJB75241.1 MAG: hypothetical protein CO096_02295 [Armatimonadetes bacterium CG_4_9_14_3_um_filter_66_14]